MSADDEYHPLAQYVLDKIHGLVQSFQSFIRKKDNKIKERLALAALKDIHILTEKLFENGGSNAIDIIEKLDDIDNLLKKLNTKRNIITNVIDASQTNEIQLNGDIITCPMTLKSLQDIISRVKDTEKTFSFQHKLWIEKNKVAKTLNCSVEQLTYGSSSVELWMNLVKSDSWKQAIFLSTNNDDSDNPKAIVFGSSQGLLSFYSSVLNYNYHKINISVIGYEILPYLHRLAIELLNDYRQLHSYIGNDILFLNEDMMNANIKDANIIILTSLCWDKTTRVRVARKLSSEMIKPNSIVVDYRDDTFKISGLDYNYYQQDKGDDDDDREDRYNREDLNRKPDVIIKKMNIDKLKKALFNALSVADRPNNKNDDDSEMKKKGRRFELRDIISGPASWNNDQNLYIYG